MCVLQKKKKKTTVRLNNIQSNSKEIVLFSALLFTVIHVAIVRATFFPKFEN